MNKLSIEEIKKLAPSIFASKPHESRSERYSMVPTMNMIENFRKAGWYPTKVMEERSKKFDGFQKHLIRFRQDFDDSQKRIPEIVMINSHNGRSKCEFRLGIFEVVCTNGLVIETLSLAYMKQVHVGINYDEFKKTIDVYAGNADKIMKEIPKYEAVKLTKNQRVEFATKVLKMQYFNKSGIINPDQILKTRRIEDDEPTLWKTFNVIQENIIKGGIHYDLYTDSDNIRKSTSKPVTNIYKNILFNTMLWNMMIAFYAKVK